MDDIISVAQQICGNLNKLEDETAIVIESKAYSYQFLRKRVSALGKILKATTEKEERIGLHLQNNIDCYVGLLALLVNGRTYIPINEQFGIQQLLLIIEEARVSKIIQSANTDFFEELEKNANFEIISCDSEDDDLLACLNARDIYILFTSGSTGQPKGVPITHHNLDNFIYAMVNEKAWTLSEKDKFLQPFNLSFDLFVMCVYLPLFLGASFYTVPLNKRALHSAALLESEDITVSVLVPSSMKIINKISSVLTFDSLRLSFFCGEPLYVNELNTWIKRTPNATQINIYGPTEATVVCVRFLCEKDTELEVFNGVVPIGIPFGNNELDYIRSEDGLEILISGPQVFSGYLGSSKNPFVARNGVRFYRTGDICKINENGNLVFIGRKDEQVKIDGYRIELADVENKIKWIIPEREVVVVLKRNEEHVFSLHVFIEGSEVQNLQALIRSKLPSYMQPTTLNYINTIPLNINGKTDRKKLKSLLKDE